MPRCLISFGANVGSPSETIGRAAAMLRERLASNLSAYRMSRSFHTPPVGGPAGQPPFVNAVVAVTTDRSPWEVWHAVREVELQLGRERIRRWEARRIDLDILLYDQLRIWTPQLKIPHPRMCMRRFILEPAMDVAADWTDPVSGLTIETLTRRLRGSPGSFILCADPKLQPELLLERVAREALAEWRTIEPKTRFSIGTADTSGSQNSRWVAWLPIDDAPQSLPLSPPSKLVIVLSNANEPSGAEWEDVHRELAERLRLTQAEANSVWTLPGARYLLATDDREWAIHEMAAALEAMDCPVETV
ncbi:MAG: 2-amino-4-hydroxy-6-hydroxymethyldihydropteridine diphosphokinase [Pirellulaceae bacterium]